LLKILSRVTTPTTGKINIKGRVASLLEGGTGFHPELTGREKIYLNGAILGMRKKEIDRKLDEIIDFSGVERYIDTPVKRYSSGMYVRLAFAVAAHLESEILIVDEVLAVGDAEFQKKCLGKMNDVSKGEGRTVLFVSHNMGSIDALCKRALVMKDGMLVFDGTQKEGISYYLQNEVANISNFREWKEIDAPGDERARILKLEVTSPDGKNEINFSSGIIIKATIKSNITDQALDFSYNLKSEKEELLFHHGSLIADKSELVKGLYNISVLIPPYLLNKGSYLIDAWMGLSGVEMVGKMQENVIGFSVTANEIDEIIKELPGLLRPKLFYQIEKEN
jgi:lipopolysaccharide transport system ATP-binding protein